MALDPANAPPSAPGDGPGNGVMPDIVFLVLRRLRRPLLVLISAYAISTLGFTLIPGVDDQGRPWRMDFFHAFYFVSFMGSTIGFGELPYTFTDAQRFWTLFSIYLTVISWLYAIGAIITIIQDQRLRRVIAMSGFARTTRHLREPFHIVCGYGDTGQLIVSELAEHGSRCTVIDIDEDRIHRLAIEDLPVHAPGLHADAQDTESLLAAGLRHPYCRGVIAVTNSDAANLKIAITAKLLRPSLKVYCRSERRETAANMASFGTDSITNAYETFAERFSLLFHSPSMFLVHEWITSPHNEPLSEFITPPKGKWVICGYGRFGRALHARLEALDLPVQVIERNPEETGAPPGTVKGTGTEAATLLEAGIHHAVGIVAGTDDDANNLSILMTARDLRHDLFTVARQNETRNTALFRAARIDRVMQPSRILAENILAEILIPLLGEFLQLAARRDEVWANLLVSRVSGVVEDRAHDTWVLRLDEQQAPAVIDQMKEGCEIRLAHLLTDPHDPARRLRCVPLLLHRDGVGRLLPEDDTRLQRNDQLLFCGLPEAEDDMRLLVANYNMLNYIVTGEDRPAGYIWQWLSRRRARAGSATG